MPKRSAVRAAPLILASLGLLISYGLVVFADLPSNKADGSPSVIWMDESQSKILFISESALNQVSLTRFPELVSLEQAHRMRRQPGIYSEMFTGKQIPDCQQTDSARSPQGSAAHPKELQDLILSSDRVFAGTIEALVPGWDAWRNNTAVLAWIGVEEVLQAQTENDAVKPDARIGVLFKGGALTIEGVRLCHKIDKNFYHPEIGDRILVTALPCGPCEGITPCVPCESTFLNKHHVFPIVGSEVQPQPYTNLSKEARPASLLDLRLNSQGLVMRQMSGVRNPRSRYLPVRTLGGQIIWVDEAKEHPVFLPQGVLQGASVDQLPLDRHVSPTGSRR